MQADAVEEVAEIKMGDIEFQGNNISTPGVKFDKIAFTQGGSLLMVSVVADTQRVKQIRAILSGGAKALVQAAGVKARQAERGEARTIGRLYPAPDGYTEHKHKLGFGMAHAIFFTKMPGFMKIVTPESLWRELNDTRFTTPILHEWMPYIERELRDRDLLENAWSFGCRCGILSAVTTNLDEIVSEGIKRSKIRIA